MATGSHDVREHGAAGDGERRDTDAIQDALDACAAEGGTVRVPPGTYHTGPLRVGDRTTLHLEAGATLRFVGDHEAFPAIEGRWEGWNQVGFHPCLRIEGENAAVTGRGTLDGGGAYWWDLVDAPSGEYPDGLAERLADLRERNEKADDVSSFTLRPPLLQVYRSEDVRIEGITARNSPFWNTHVVYSEDVAIRGVRIENPPDAPNGDGIDVDSSRFVRIADAYIDAGDDAICLKSGKDAEGRRIGRPCADVTVTNCTVRRGHGGVVIGSETAGDVRDVTVSNCTFAGTDRGIRIKTQRGRGGVVEDLRFDSIVMREVVCPVVINGYYFTDVTADPVPVDEGTPLVRNVHFHHITARDACTAGFLAGLPERRFSGLTFEDVRIEATRPFADADAEPAMAGDYDQRPGLFCRTVSDLRLSDVRIETREGPALEVEVADGVEVDGFRADSGADAPVVSLQDVTGARVRDATCPDDVEPFLRVRGGSVAVETADLGASTPVDAGSGADVERR